MPGLIAWLTSTYGQLASLMGICVGIVGALWLLADRAEKVVSATGRAAIIGFIKGDVDRPFHVIANSMAGAFDAVFGTHVLSRRFIARSIVASILFSSSLFALWMVLFPDQLHILIFEDEDNDLPMIVALFVVYTIFLNLLPDYIALLKTRYAIRLMKGRSFWVSLIILLMDAVASGVIGVCAIFIMLGAFWSNLVTWSGLHATFVVVKQDLPLIARGKVLIQSEFSVFHPLAPNLYSTFLASVWLWLYVASACLLRLLPFARRAASLRWWFKIDEAPFLSLAAMSSILVFVGYLMAVPLVILF